MKYVVAYLSFFDNDLQVKVVNAENWWIALEAAFPGKLEHLGDVMDVGTLEDAKEEAFNQDWLFTVCEVK